MKKRITEFMGRRVSSDVFDLRLGQVSAFAVGGLVFILSVWKLTRLDLTEAQLFLGVLLALIVPLLCIIMGFLCQIAAAVRK